MVQKDRPQAASDNSHFRLIRYWRSCVADVALGKGRFSRRELSSGRNGFVEFSTDELFSGRAGMETVKRIFRNRDENIDQVPVCLRPLLAARRMSHGAERLDSLPDYVAPIATFALVARKDGSVWPQRTVIARDVLEPLPEGAFSIGTVETLDSFLAETPFSEPGEGEPHDRVWKSYRDDCKRLLDTVTGGWPQEGAEYERAGRGLMDVSADAAATVRGTLRLYDNILETRPAAPLLENFAVSAAKPVSPNLDMPYDLAGRLGHATDEFPLADKQRDVLAHLAVAEDGEILAVNGPPGTGKTTLLLSAIAGEWVRAARAGGDPPVIAAASTNNQAVTNIIDAFAKDFARGKGPFAGRWLPDIGSFGLFLASRSREARAADKYQTEDFFTRLETATYVRRAMEKYLAAAKEALPQLQTIDLKSVVDALHASIEAEVGKLEAAEAMRKRLSAALGKVESILGASPEERLDALEANRAQIAGEEASNNRLLSEWTKYLADESMFLSLFGFLPPVARKRRLKARAFLQGTEYGGDLNARLDIRAVEPELIRRVDTSRERLGRANADLAQGKDAMAGLTRTRSDYADALKNVGADATRPEDHDAVERALDCGGRFRLFLLATHYWEGRWLLEMEGLLPNIGDEQRRRGEKVVARRWRRRMMLTPCMVSTFATLPGKMTVSKYANGEFSDEYLFNFIDLLIVDEAGQVLPEVAGGSFALAKRALVIGDTQQIEPISLLPRSVDIGNLMESGLLSESHTEEDLDRIDKLGIASKGGSVMQVAQSACRYRPESELDRGLYLFEHRRCFDEIVSYCNALCYKGKLQPRRGSALGGSLSEPGSGLAPFAYLHVDGICTASGGSRRNNTEARTIAAWLAAQRDVLEGAYRKPLEEIVGVVTPFGRQVREIRNACKAAGVRVDGRGGMTVGTVHSLQGADRNIVIFSPTYSKHADGEFIDMSPSMLNVAVSRARDSFLTFGDMDLFSIAAYGTPRRLLSEFLLARAENALEFDVLPRDDLVPSDKAMETLRDAKEHDAFLMNLLSSDARKVTIVSPWVVARTMERTGIIAALGRARRQGMEIDIYVDPALNDGDAGQGRSNLERAEAAFSEIGVKLRKVRQLHSKIVIADETLLTVGSFNWLSADRVGRYARHETSLVYRGTHLSKEIEVIIGSLHQRAAASGG